MPKKLTKPVLESLTPAPKGKTTYLYDANLNGFGVRVGSSGERVFFFQGWQRGYNKQVRVRIGRFPDMTVDEARSVALDCRKRLDAGQNPNELKRAAANEATKKSALAKARAITLSQAFTAYTKARTLKPSTRYWYARFLESAFPDWKDRPIAELTKDEISHRHAMLGEKSGPAFANGAMRFLNAVINFARYQYEAPDGTPLMESNPVSRISHTRAWFPVKRRKTYIRPNELKPWFAALQELKSDKTDYEAVAVADWLQVLIFSGLRRNEALKLKWPDIDFADRTLLVRDPKNSEDHLLPLSDALLDIFQSRHENAEGEFVFPGSGKHGHLVDPRKILGRVVSLSGVTFTPHDLRRTFITIADGLDISTYTVKRMANHAMSQDVTAGYIVRDVERLRKPIQAITDVILKYAGLKPSAQVFSFEKKPSAIAHSLLAASPS
jgi:integrase